MTSLAGWPMRILIVEDEPEIAQLLTEQLQDSGLECDRVITIADALTALKSFAYELVLLDRRLPDGDGLAAIPQIRGLRSNMRIIVLTARDAPLEKANGLDAGADDYVAKPYDRAELVARIRARLRQTSATALPPIRIGAIAFDHGTGQLTIGERPFVANRREFCLLEALVRRVNQVAPRNVLLQEVYGFEEAVLPGALDTLVSRLRKRLLDPDSKVVIHLVRGRGYLLTEDVS
jgi:two-component system, OmpR family, response regulator